MPGFVYIIQSLTNQRLYIGSTQNVTSRLNQHNSSSSKYTSHSGPWKLVFSQEFPSPEIARNYEHLLKKLKNRKVLDQIIAKGKFYLTPAGTINW